MQGGLVPGHVTGGRLSPTRGFPGTWVGVRPVGWDPGCLKGRGQWEPGGGSELDGTAVSLPCPRHWPFHDIKVVPLWPGLAQQATLQIPHEASEG